MSISRLSSRLIQQNTRGTIQLRSMSSLTVPHINGLPTAHHPGRTGKQDKLLFTPGPLTTSYTTKAAAVRDLGSRDQAFINIVREVRSKLLQVANVDDCMFTSIPIQGSGTYAVEATLSSAIPKDQGVLIIANGAYGMRMATIAKAHNIRHTVLEFPDDTQPDLKRIEAALLTSAKHHSHVAVVHSETTSGIINNIEAIGQLVFQYKKHYIVDAMSSFGAVPIDFEKAQIDYLVSSANKCIEGIPGFSFIIARHNVLALTKGMADTLALDIYAQCIGLDKDGQFRFTPPTHSLLAFHQALKELEQEGGVKKRAERYRENQRILMAGMSKLGFELYLPSANQGYIISSYRYPKDSNWNFNTFYNKLNDLDFVIYPGKVSNADCFRIGHIGRLFPEDTRELLVAIERVCREMKTAAFATKSAL